MDSLTVAARPVGPVTPPAIEQRQQLLTQSIRHQGFGAELLQRSEPQSQHRLVAQRGACYDPLKQCRQVLVVPALTICTRGPRRRVEPPIADGEGASER